MSEPISRLNAALEGRYRLERELGQGGMATVYLAQDLRHDRKVALKVLRPELAAGIGVERFLTEIKTTANLHHPHILPLHDSGEVAGFVFYVMPYVEGESLRARLDRERQLPVDEAVRVATNVAEALDYAHARGVIHRDIKPANILLQAGKPVVSDFGIALAVSAGGGERLTETGLSLGTPHYMSPEQATGERHVGPGTDIYALGCVLYETLVGEPPYTGSTPQAILGKIITGTLEPVATQRKSVPPNVDAAVSRALEKLTADRFTTARDFASALSDPGFRHGDARAAVARQPRLWKGLAITLAGTTLLSMAALVWAFLPSGSFQPAAQFEVVLPADLSVYRGPSHSVDISPDGSSIVFTGVSDDGRVGLWLRRTTQLSPVPIGGTDDGQNPRFSPDGEWIAFTRDGDLLVVPPTGAPPRIVLRAVSAGFGLAWGPDGSIYFSRGSDGIWRTDLDGDGVEQIVAPEPDAGVGYLWPEVLPDAKGVLFTSGAVETQRDAEIKVVSHETGRVTTLAQGQMARWAPSGHLLYVSADANLLAAPFDLDRLEMGAARSILEGVEVRGTMASYFALSRSGALAYLPDVPPLSVELVWVTRTGEATPVDPDWRFVPGGGIWGFDLAPEGDRVAVSALVDGNTDIWIRHLPDGAFERLTFDVEAETHPAWSPDGRIVTYWRGGDEGGLWTSRADGTGIPVALLEGGPVLMEGNWSPDGDVIVGRTSGNVPTMGMRDIVGFRPGVDSVPVPLVADPQVAEQNAALSPDGRWLAYASAEGGQHHVYVSPFPEVEAGRVRISMDVATHPLWSNRGDELFFWTFSGGNSIVAAQVATEPAFSVLRRRALFAPASQFNAGAGSSRIWAISPDDGRFLMARTAEADAPPRYVVDQGFGARLAQQMGRR